MRSYLAYMLVIMLSFSTIAPASANHNCESREGLKNRLNGEYSETVELYGVTNNGDLIEVYTSEKGETWTIVLTRPNMISCLVVAGKDWKTLEKKEEPSARDGL